MLRNVDVETIEYLALAVQARIQCLQEEELHGLDAEVDWNANPWKSCSLIDQGIYEQFHSKVHVFSVSVVSARKVLRASAIWKKFGRQDFLLHSFREVS